MLQAVKGQNTKFSIFTGDVVEGILPSHQFYIVLMIFLAAVWLVDKQQVTPL
jgi:hypothetical protein